MSITAERRINLLQELQHIVKSNHPVPDRTVMIEALLTAELLSVGPTPSSANNFNAWYNLNVRPMVVELLSMVNEEVPINFDIIVELTHTAYYGVYSQMNTEERVVAASLLLGKLHPALPPKHAALLTLWYNEKTGNEVESDD